MPDIKDIEKSFNMFLSKEKSIKQKEKHIISDNKIISAEYDLGTNRIINVKYKK